LTTRGSKLLCVHSPPSPNDKWTAQFSRVDPEKSPRNLRRPGFSSTSNGWCPLLFRKLRFFFAWTLPPKTRVRSFGPVKYPHQTASPYFFMTNFLNVVGGSLIASAVQLLLHFILAGCLVCQKAPKPRTEAGFFYLLVVLLFLG